VDQIRNEQSSASFGGDCALDSREWKMTMSRPIVRVAKTEFAGAAARMILTPSFALLDSGGSDGLFCPCETLQQDLLAQQLILHPVAPVSLESMHELAGA
jgi:hypothetical protein